MDIGKLYVQHNPKPRLLKKGKHLQKWLTTKYSLYWLIKRKI